MSLNTTVRVPFAAGVATTAAPSVGISPFFGLGFTEPATQPATPQYATVEMLEQLQAQIDERLSAFQNVPRNSKKGGTVDE